MHFSFESIKTLIDVASHLKVGEIVMEAFKPDNTNVYG